MSTYTLPDAAEIRAFADKVNEIRAGFHLPPIQTWDVTGSDPNNGQRCLSARHLLGPIELGTSEPQETEYAWVGTTHFRSLPPHVAARLGADRDNSVDIPAEIRAVTDPFDRFGELPPGSDVRAKQQLVAAFRDAGLDAE